MVKELPTLGDLEIHVLRWIWQEQPCTERTVWEHVRRDRSVGRTTVLKTLQRLEAKGLLIRVKAEGPVQYRAAVDERRLLPAIVDAVKTTLDKTPPELAADIMEQGIMVTGGGALLAGINRRLNHETGMPIKIAHDPLYSVVIGSGRALENIDAMRGLQHAQERPWAPTPIAAASSSPACRRRARAATTRDASPSTSRAGVAKPARATA